MAKKVQAMVKLQIAAGKATPAPPVGTALGPQGVNIMDFCKNFISRTAKDEGLIIPVVVTVYADRSYTFITKTPPAPVLLKRAASLSRRSAEPNKTKVGTVTTKQVEDIAKLKMPDLNAESLEAAVKTVAGTQRPMGLDVVGWLVIGELVIWRLREPPIHQLCEFANVEWESVKRSFGPR